MEELWTIGSKLVFVVESVPGSIKELVRKVQSARSAFYVILHGRVLGFTGRLREGDWSVDLEDTVACINSSQMARALDGASEWGLGRRHEVGGYCTTGEQELFEVVFNAASRYGLDWIWHEDQDPIDVIDQFGECWDELSGGKLSADGVRAARAGEMGYVSRYAAYRTDPVEDCWKQTGAKPIEIAGLIPTRVALCTRSTDRG